ncbi:hypothetical protein [Thalassobacillus sp. CUG 92003]|uniref:hypothetical protein n=1 Tax=Thalassobacillus sp. CUG 92003 TaxID=2736641 RepID=UPI0015E78FCC|nr:hypothetical protein [Thalassobacillus sp. CUG 92003]
MKRIFGIMSVIVVIGVVVFFMMNRPEKTTYGDLLHKELTSYDVINEVYIKQVGDEFTTITNRNDIEKIIENPADMNLKKVDDPPYVQYSVTIRTEEKNDPTIAVGEERIHILGLKNEDGSDAGGMYEIEGNNSLLKVITETDYNWESL